MTLSKVGAAAAGAPAPAGFHTGIVLRFPTIPGAPYPTQLYWGLYPASPNGRMTLRLGRTGAQNLVEARGIAKTLVLRITYAPANCAYRFSYAYPGETSFTDSGYTYNSCAQNPQVGLMTKTFGARIAVTTDVDWFDIRTS